MQLIGRIILASCNFVYSLICTYVLKDGLKRAALKPGNQFSNLTGRNAGRQTSVRQMYCRQKYMQAEVHAGRSTCRQKYMQAEVHAGRSTCRQKYVHVSKSTGKQIYRQLEVQPRQPDAQTSIRTGRQTIGQAVLKINKYTGRQTYRRANIQTVNRIGGHTSTSQMSRQAEVQAGRRTGRQT
jgi:hypothetical protein